jgi:hypothetical protein
LSLNCLSRYSGLFGVSAMGNMKNGSLIMKFS